MQAIETGTADMEITMGITKEYILMMIYKAGRSYTFPPAFLLISSL